MCVCAGVERNERGREGVTILMSDLWYRAMVDFVCVSTRILMVKFKFEKVKVCVVVMYGPSEGNVEENTIFWDNLNDILDRVSSCLLYTSDAADERSSVDLGGRRI